MEVRTVYRTMKVSTDRSEGREASRRTESFREASCALILVLSVLRLVGHSDRQLELALAEQAHVDQVLLVLESEGC